MKIQTIGVLLIASLLVGCQSRVRSISSSSYQESDQTPGPRSGELDEFDVLGIDRRAVISEDDIRHAMASAHRVRLTPGGTILLIQSGAAFPDGVMVGELNKFFRIVPFTGVATEKNAEGWREGDSRRSTRNAVIVIDPDKPATVVPLSTLATQKYRTETAKADPAAYSRLLRLAAARAGADTIVCYWGILESGEEQILTKTISWVPVMNWIVPDERQHMRIRLKVAVIDVPTGSWSVLSAQPFEVKSWSVRSRREVVDQRQVEALKTKAYEAAARDLVRVYSSVSGT